MCLLSIRSDYLTSISLIDVVHVVGSSVHISNSLQNQPKLRSVGGELRTLTCDQHRMGE
jgi:hypothetical protein